ncbi:pentatricopeptide repeat-containing protein At5g59600-like [Nicotiana tabacum]|uniref:Pentatricopeptide repeat-containing protein At5g59600-like n=2 Tax=Nicotiana TaxID=4085 RepID=A0A1S3XB42_TOBAC|nr:PREDICTED: pentatricopeptide repeat-containing protein At5g59600 [Nicotiana sylvestris]XP_016437160.1 PREDICTED: pentatricopeptide repeat-containing protein At5g59600-like [Nicotiana tabacum]
MVIGAKVARVSTNPIVYHFFNCTPDVYTKLLEAYAQSGALQSGKTLHAHLVINGLAQKAHFATKLVAFYTECRQLLHARKLFDKIPQSNIRRWIVLIGAYARHGFYEEAMSVFSEMQREGMKPNKFVLPSVLKACGRFNDFRIGEILHSVILKNEFEYDSYVVSALIDMYSKCGKVEKAKRVFYGMVDKDLVAMNALVAGYLQYGIVNDALVLVEEMKVQGMKPNVVTYNTLIAGFSQEDDQVMVCKVIELMHDDGLELDVVSWTSIISGLVQNFHNKEAFGMFKRMLDVRLCPTSATISSILPACATVADLMLGKEIHGYSVVTGIEKDVYVKSALIDMYAKCGFISEAKELFSKTSERNSVTWNSMIFGYANHGYCSEAIELFNQMLREEERKPDHLTFTAALTACIHAGIVQYGESLFKMMQDKYAIKPRSEHFACMVDLLGRAGKLVEAYNLIQSMPIEPDLFAWGAFLGACRQHGNMDLAEIAAKQLAKLEPESAGSSVLLSSLYADASKWAKVAKVKRVIKKKKLKKFPGCSWVEVA